MTAPSTPSPSNDPTPSTGAVDELAAHEANFLRAAQTVAARAYLDDAGRFELGVAWLNVGQARLRRAERDQAEPVAREALAAYAEAITALDAITLHPPAARQALGAAHLNRAVTLRALGDATAAREALERAVATLGEPAAKSDPAGACNFAGALLNRAAWCLEAAAATGAYDAKADASAAADLARSIAEARAVRPHPGAFFAELNARLVDLDRRARQVTAPHAGDNAVGELDDEIEAAIGVAREARETGCILPVPMVGRAVNLGAQLLATFQPQFLLEFLETHRVLAAEPNPLLPVADFRAIAAAAFTRGRETLRTQWQNPAANARRSLAELSEIEASLAAAAASPDYAAPA